MGLLLLPPKSCRAPVGTEDRPPTAWPELAELPLDGSGSSAMRYQWVGGGGGWTSRGKGLQAGGGDTPSQRKQHFGWFPGQPPKGKRREAVGFILHGDRDLLCRGWVWGASWWGACPMG